MYWLAMATRVLHIGNSIRSVLAAQGRTASWLAAQIPCDRTNVYKIFKHESIDVATLRKIGSILQHDFFKELSEFYFPAGQQ